MTFGTEERPAYTDQFTVGSATLAARLPEGARVFQLDGDEARSLGRPDGSAVIVSWPRHDLSSVSSFTGIPFQSSIGDLAYFTESVRLELWPIDCTTFDDFQGKDDAADETSSLNGQPFSYTRFEMPDPKPIHAGRGRWVDPDLNTFYALKLGEQPCSAVMAKESYMTTSDPNSLKGFGYRLFVEGDGTVTSSSQ
ncbi:hypothetical protein [Rhodococcus sp. ACT016]|uniref:hypothetical protein n=1 Tax=Rhodococcus sp. ACT016 TaxID=3134808 RepID=UPI003D2A11B0